MHKKLYRCLQVIMVLRPLGLYQIGPGATGKVVFQIVSHVLAYSNSLVNPILYAFLSQPFRRGFWAGVTTSQLYSRSVRAVQKLHRDGR